MTQGSECDGMSRSSSSLVSTRKLFCPGEHIIHPKESDKEIIQTSLTLTSDSETWVKQTWTWWSSKSRTVEIHILPEDICCFHDWSPLFECYTICTSTLQWILSMCKKTNYLVPRLGSCKCVSVYKNVLPNLLLKTDRSAVTLQLRSEGKYQVHQVTEMLWMSNSRPKINDIR